ncbi:hypothetical protein [Jiangella alkaliphila]|uniref:Uncharacterized protein n=2 Tax=Jiangella alkaliphila TaxID=419479 RepID=A0A1H2L269_9ACTN|nr:hypothetical protein [Jiangella alkaliphila]SDU74884.1 hypothetical protein SAMN04488563_4835 [Jiangella alkaliphila]
MTVIEIPTDAYLAADWLAARHPWVRQLVERIAGPVDRREDWLDVLTQAVNDSDGDGAAWVEYERRHPAPAEDAAFWEWHAQGPQPAPPVRAFGVMSGGEKRLIRLVATLGGRLGWSPLDVSFDQRGAAVLADWLAIVHAQLPASMYPAASDDALIVRLAAVNDATNGEVRAVSR